ncbi:MAG: hypothetical protein IJA99_04360 [Oscillospiraceae bacterium]|nr:hypothetical protein [Oscillospiraceae bacterium]
MKRLICLIISITLLLSLFGCGEGSTAPESASALKPQAAPAVPCIPIT